jgi:hypothetical protein
MHTVKAGFILGFLSIIVILGIGLFISTKTQLFTLVRYNGDSVTPLVFDRKTYVSTVKISNTLGKSVTFDRPTNSLNIGALLKLKRADFDTIRLGMTINEVESIVGQAQIFLTSGLHQVGYDLEDGTLMGLFYIPGVNHKETLKEMFLINKDGTRTILLAENP